MKSKSAEYCRNTRFRHKDDVEFRLKRLLWQAKNRSIKKGLIFNITLLDLLEIYPKDSKCPVFGMPLKFNSNGKGGDRSNSPSIDKVNPFGGYTKDNIRIISWKANELKRSSTIEQLELILQYMKDN